MEGIGRDNSILSGKEEMRWESGSQKADTIQGYATQVANAAHAAWVVPTWFVLWNQALGQGRQLHQPTASNREAW